MQALHMLSFTLIRHQRRPTQEALSLPKKKAKPHHPTGMDASLY